MTRIKFGAQLPNSDAPWEKIRDVTVTADRLRWNSIWTFDHLVPPMGAFAKHLDHPQGEDGPTLEGWTLLPALAALTKRVRLGCLVTANTFRNPAVLAKMAATTDIIANGRLELGIGAAWHAREHEAYGLEFGTLKERFDRFDEALQVIRGLFDSNEPVTFHGKYYTLEQARFSPKSVQWPHPPIMVGGGGEKRTLRSVALYADTLNLFGNFLGSREEVVRKLSILEEHCATVGRDPKEIRRTVSLFAALEKDEKAASRKREFFGQGLPFEAVERLAIGSPQRIIDAVAPYVELGFDEVILMGHPIEPSYFEEFDREVIAAFDVARV
jgi:F420-dependent oxidoreductase-like protein